MKIMNFFVPFTLFLLLCLFRGTCAMSSQLEAFHKAFEEAKQELESIKSGLGIADEELLRQRRRTIDELLSNFQRDVELADEMEIGDDWYRNYGDTASSKGGGCKGNRCGGDWKQEPRKLRKRVNMNEDLNEIAKLNLKYKGISNKVKNVLVNRINNHSSQPPSSTAKFKSILEKIEENNNRIGTIIQNAGFANQNDKAAVGTVGTIGEKNQFSPLGNLKDNKDMHFNLDNFDLKSSLQTKDKTENLDVTRDKVKPDFDLDLDIKPNMKPDAASYAKFIEDINLPSIANDQLEETKNDLSHEANYKLSKIEQDAAEKKKEIKWKVKTQDLVKRNLRFNPMSEIKLKTSYRLMDHGFGPSLPSNSLVESRRMMKIDDIIKKMEKTLDPEVGSKDDIQKLDSLLSLDENSLGAVKTRFKRLQDLSNEELNQLSVALQDTGENEAVGVDPGDVAQSVDTYRRTKRISDTRNCDQQKSTDKKADNKDDSNGLKRHSASKTEESKKAGETNEETKKEPEKKKDQTVLLGDNKVNETRLAREKEQPKRRVKRIGVFGGLSLADHIGNLGEFEEVPLPNEDELLHRDKRQATLSRHKRCTEQDVLDENKDFDTVERNEDEVNVRVKRSTLATEAAANVTMAANFSAMSSIATPTQSTSVAVNATNHKLYKRSTHLQDEVEDNNSDSHKMGNNRVKAPNVGSSGSGVVGKEDDYDESTRREKRQPTKSFDFGTAARTLGLERFDNMKQKAAIMNVDGMKFDNLYNDNESKSVTVGHSFGSSKSNSSNNNKNNNSSSSSSNNNKSNYHSKHMDEYLDLKTSLTNVAKNKDDTNKISFSILNSLSNNSHHLSDDTKRDSDPQECKDKDDGKKLMLALRDEILNCTAFSKLETYLKNYSDGHNNTANAQNSEKIGIDIGMNPTESSTTTTTQGPPTPNSTSSNPIFGIGGGGGGDGAAQPTVKKDDMMKLNITINASVMGDQKSSNFYGNGTISVHPSSSDQRERRGILFSKFDELDKRTCGSDKQSCEGGQALDNMASGKVSGQLVNSLFNLVRNHPKLKVLWPSLKNNQPSSKQQSKSSCAGQSSDNARMKSTERMLQKMMVSVNDIIEQQVRERTCVQLRPDLSAFYELILQTYAEQDNNREKRQSTLSLTSDFSKEVRAIDPSKIDEKSRIVKKLLKQYEELPQEDQQQVFALRDDLLTDLMVLRKLKDTQDTLVERRKREVAAQQQLSAEGNETDLVRQLEAAYTPAFLKLLKTSELFREAGSEKEQA